MKIFKEVEYSDQSNGQEVDLKGQNNWILRSMGEFQKLKLHFVHQRGTSLIRLVHIDPLFNLCQKNPNGRNSKCILHSYARLGGYLLSLEFLVHSLTAVLPMSRVQCNVV